jgi:hypothetical protein
MGEYCVEASTYLLARVTEGDAIEVVAEEDDWRRDNAVEAQEGDCRGDGPGAGA